ncbi:MAG: nucleotide sugar dehydrogenase [Kiloniellaceae bacterium]
MKISIFGMGYVGAVSGVCLAELGHEVIGVDTNPAKVDLINAGLSPIVEVGVAERTKAARAGGRIRATTDATEAVATSALSMISVGTPSATSGVPALAALDAVASDIARALKSKKAAHTVVVRSTVLPGTTEARVVPALVEGSGRKLGSGLEVCYNPEFLREGSAVKDFFDPPFTIAGCMSDAGFAVLKDLYAGLEAQLIRTDCRVAESLKYVSNAFHAVKITFANEIGTLLKTLGIDSRETMRIFCEDRDLNISPVYLRPGYAFGGSCLPKELRALQSLARSRHIDLPMLSQVLNSNQKHIDQAFEMISRRGRSKVALFGLAFKPGTDDLRESPLVVLAERLIGKGYDLAIFDRGVEAARLVGSNREYIEREIPHFERLLAADPVQALDGAKVVVVGHVGPEEIAAIRDSHNGRTIIDLQGVREIQDLPGVDYEGICW